MATPSAAEQEALVSQVSEVADVSVEASRRLLRAADWVVEDAIALHFGGALGDDDDADADAGRGAAAPAREEDSARSRQVEPGSDEDEPVVPPEQPGVLGFLGRTLTDLGQAVMGVATEDFQCWFATRYGAPAPPFSKDCFGDAVKGALDNGRLLLMWFHQEHSLATERLCREILQNSLVVRAIRRSYTLWAGDVGRFEPGQISRLLNVVNFPTLVVCKPVRSGIAAMAGFCLEWPLGTFAQPLFRVSPEQAGEPLNADQAIAALTAAAEDQREAAQAHEEETAARNHHLAEERRLREEQDREFEESLLMDQLSEVRRSEETAAAVVASTQAAAAEASATEASAAAPGATETDAPAKAGAVDSPVGCALSDEEESHRQARGAEISASPEPAAAGSQTARLSLRLPSGDRLQRTFQAEKLLEEVYEWAHCCRPVAQPVKFVLCTTFPARTLTDRHQTLAELGLTPNAALLMKEGDS